MSNPSESNLQILQNRIIQMIKNIDSKHKVRVIYCFLVGYLGHNR